MTQPVPHHSSQAARRRESDRIRKREARAKMKVEGIPHSSLVDYAIAQAVAFSLTYADKGAFRPDANWTPINASVVFAIAVDVLAVRFGKDRGKSFEAVKAKLGPQRGHTVAGMIPSSNPAPGHPRYNMAAPKDLSTPESIAPPLPPQDMSRQATLIR